MSRRFLLPLIPAVLALAFLSCQGWRRSKTESSPPPQLAEDNRLLDEIERLEEVMTLEAGARVLSAPIDTSNWNAAALIDDQRARSWSSAPGTQPPFTFVIELNQIPHLKVLRFDNNTQDARSKGASAHEILVEASSSSPSAGFTEILRTQLQPQRHRQLFGVDAEARWIRLTILSNYGSRTSTELSDFRAYGSPQLQEKKAFDLTGNWKTNYGNVQFVQTGNVVRGCYHTFIGGAGVIDGRLDGRTLLFHFAEESNAVGVGMMTVNAEAGKLTGVWSYMSDKYYRGQWYATRVSGKSDKCGGGFSFEEVIDRAWARYRRVYMWSLGGAPDSGAIDETFRASVARLAAILEKEPDLRVTIRVHTDQSPNEEQNQKASSLRAAELKRILVENYNVQPHRIDAYGIGNSDPIVPQDRKWNKLLALENDFVEFADVRTPRSSKPIPD